MSITRALNILAATLLTATVATTGFSPVASAAASKVDCSGGGNGSEGWYLGCDSLNGANTVWYVDGARIPEATGYPYYSFSCTYGRVYTVTVNPGTFYAGTWSGACGDTYA